MVGNTAINYEGALTVVETMVVTAEVDAAASAAAPEAGNSGGGIGSVDVGSSAKPELLRPTWALCFLRWNWIFYFPGAFS